MLKSKLFSVIFIFLLDPIAEGVQNEEIDDVTTIYTLFDPSNATETDYPIEIRMRTNALGMAPFTEFGFVEPVNKNDGILCFGGSISDEGFICEWSLNGFQWVPSTDSYIDQTYENGLKKFMRGWLLVEGCKDNRDDYCNYYRENGCIGNQYRSTDPRYDQFCNIDILSKSKGGYFYRFQTSSRCKTCNIDGTINLCDTENEESCKPIQRFNLGSTRAPFIRIEMKNYAFNAWLGDKKNLLLFSIEDNYLNNSMKIVKAHKDAQISPPIVYSSYRLQANKSNSTLISPRVVINRSEFCLRVVLHTFNTIVQDSVLSATAVDALNNQYLLGTLHPNTSGQHLWKVETSLPADLQGEPFNIVLTSLSELKLEIERIASCNNEDREEVSVITKEQTTNDYGRAYLVYNKEPTQIDLESSSTSECLNGGVFTSAGCACPAGFSGANCNKACGPNRFGQDCGGKCSIYDTECKGLRLCTPGAGCHCAPGYHGPLCEIECIEGSYGADCDQSCGHCLEFNAVSGKAVCNKYSGRCTKCQPGYYLPYCSEKYIHFKTPPVLSSHKYKTLTLSIDFSKDNMEGMGQAMFYQVQYKIDQNVYNGFLILKNPWDIYTTKHIPKDESTVDIEMVDLEDATEYLVRVVLVAVDFNSYQGEDLPVAKTSTKCDIPESDEYNIKFYSKLLDHLQEIKITWSYELQDHWCPVVNYELTRREGWKFINTTTTDTLLYLNKILPDEEIEFKLRAKTIAGYAPSSKNVKTFNLYDNAGHSEVDNLKVVSTERNRADLSWDPPVNLKHLDIDYVVSFKCVRYLSCSKICESSGSVTTAETTTSLIPLLPAAQYEVSVAVDLGPKVYLNLGTLESVPVEIPSVSEKGFIRTNSSATVFWKHAQVCTGFFETYHYELFLASDSTKALETGKTRDTNATFDKLQASTNYVVQVSVVTTGGWDPTNFLAINLSTSATVPEPVRNLTVYKRGRNMVGLRWAEPRALYGALESFTVTYSQGIEEKSATVQPTPCVPWPHLYCHTVTGLKPARAYNFTVNARNKEIHEDGVGASVIGPTRESSPGASDNLSVVNVTSTSLGLQWEHPSLVNGILRSFLVSVEETEQYDQDNCCQVYPVIEVGVTEEQRYFQLEVSGLHPASMYTVSVSGKTIGFGPSQTVTAVTRPPVTVFLPPDVTIVGVQEWNWMPQTRLPDVNNSQVYTSLIKSHILLVITNHTEVEMGIEDERLYTLLKAEISAPFYFAAEYAEGDIVTVGAGEEGDCQWGHFSNPPLEEGEYELAAVQVSEYNKVLNINIVLSTSFTS